MDLATGAAGVLLALGAAFDDPAPCLPFLGASAADLARPDPDRLRMTERR